MHIDAERGRRRVVGEAPLLAADLGEIKAAPAEFFRHRHRQIAGAPEILEILVKEAVLAIVSAAPLGKPVQQLVGQDVLARLHGGLPEVQ